MVSLVCGAESVPRKKLGITADSRMNQRVLVDIALQDRQAEIVGTNTANQHVVTVIHQVLGRNGRANIGTGFGDKGHGIVGSDVFHHHFSVPGSG